nr:hypothetical protein [Saprospiraceae bacterium]
ALIIMVALLVTLLKLYFSIRSTRTNSIHYWIVAIPFSIYTSWICVALIANTSAVLVHHGFSGWGVSAAHWTVIMMIIASLLSSVFILRERDIPFGLVTIWALLGIYMKRDPFRFPDEQVIVSTGLVLMIGLGLLIAYRILRSKAPLST